MTTKETTLTPHRSKPLTIAILASLIAMVSASALLSPYIVKAGFCAAGAGCDAVAQSPYATLFGIPRALFGLIAFCALLVMCMWPHRLAQKTRPFAGLFAAFEGVRLLLLQHFVIKAWCPFCVVIDVAAIVAGVCIAWDYITQRKRMSAGPSVCYGPTWLWGTLAFFGSLTPIAIAPSAGSKNASGTIEHVGTTADGKIIVREFVDLQCPYCRLTHKSIRTFIDKHPGALVIDRKHIPLAGHPHARPAAQGALCARAQGKEEAFIDAVVDTVDDPTREKCREIAGKIGLNVNEYESCLLSKMPNEQLELDRLFYEKQNLPGLPVVDVATTRSIGALSDEGAEKLLSPYVKKR